MAKRVWRKVVGHRRQDRTYGDGTHRIIKLECGHEDGRKPSQGLPNRMACWQCEAEGRL